MAYHILSDSERIFHLKLSDLLQGYMRSTQYLISMMSVS